ncbi:LHX2 [Cordylochernes scorpioides]|uniref:LHX2 n=1 Tax=Cordylochernes scorpioides TaxID=51811 RepID=A0ABY6KPC1_9ARAC|nr:LHX2 [Cordylochernes scorpioides]
MLVMFGGPRTGVWCAGCDQLITDRYYLMAVEKPWHARCLRCSQCQTTLDSQRSCFARDGRIYCKEDYYRFVYTLSITYNDMSISPSEFVMRARDLVYHVQCFTCEECGRLLTTGQTFGLREGTVLCRDHFTPPDPPPPHKGRPRKRKLFYDSTPEVAPTAAGPEACCLHHSAAESTDSCPEDQSCDPGRLGSVCRPKRMRTSFKHHQLRDMKLFFSVNHNPDSKELKQLAQKTGLSKRVLQVG